MLVAACALGLVAFAAPGVAAGGCSNDDFRVGPSAHLPDCRAYELVSPSEISAGFPPRAHGQSDWRQMFAYPTVADLGDTTGALFMISGGALPGIGGTGAHDAYRSVRGPDGWVTLLNGPTGAQTIYPALGGVDATHDYTFAMVIPQGGIADPGSLTAEAGGDRSSWLRGPDGSFEALGQGSLATDYRSCGYYISPGAEHVIFTSGSEPCAGSAQPPVQLEPEAPPSPGKAIYDRSADGPTKVISLLPGGGAAGNASFQGVSVDGTVVLFSAGSALYARVDNSKTIELSAGGATPAGASDDGSHIFYVEGGDAYSVDSATEIVTQITAVGDAQLTNISADGRRVYFVSSTQIGGEGAAGQPNLYLWDRNSGSTTFVATVAPADLGAPGAGIPGLGGWTAAVGPQTQPLATGPGSTSSRATPSGDVLVFESSAQLTAYDNAGHIEIYRYATADGSLVCVSCRPDGTPPTGDARLSVVVDPLLGPALTELYPSDDVGNVSDDGELVAFQTTDRLVARDVTDAQDVYQWRLDPQSGSGQVSLLSSGRDRVRTVVLGPFEIPRPTNSLYGMTPDGTDILIHTPATLLESDRDDGRSSIYSARVGGGFPSAATSNGCTGDECQGRVSRPPAAPSPSSADVKPTGTARSCRAVKGQARRALARQRRVASRRRRAARRAARASGPAAGRLERRARRLTRRSRLLKRRALAARRRANACRRSAR